MDDRKLTIIGAGHQGLAMAAHLSNQGVKCLLWNRTENHIKEIKESKKIVCKGLINKTISIYKVSTNIEEVLHKTIMITTPSSAHREIAKLLSGYVDDTYTIILNPGRTFGILDFIYTLKENGCNKLPVVAETQTILYTCRRDEGNSVKIYALKPNVMISAYKKEQLPKVLKSIPSCIREFFIPVDNYMQTSFGNVGMVLHCAPVLMNVGWIENKNTKFEYYYDGISSSIAGVLEKIDLERLLVAKTLGCEVEPLIKWLQRTYQTQGHNLYEHLQSNIYYRGIDAPKSVHHRYIEEDVPNGLVALESAGNFNGVDTPITSAVITLANAMMKCDYRKLGRDYNLLKDMIN